MNTKNVTDKTERKKLKRTARKKAEEAKPKAKRPADVARGSRKRKVKQMAKGQRKR
jgi:vacuolar-type H+-ATPase subunit E/Vma4